MATGRFCRAVLLLSLAVIATPSLAADPVSPPKKAKDPNEKVCETWQVLGSRLAVRRVCATRAEWADRRSCERDIIDRSQTQLCVVDSSSGLCR